MSSALTSPLSETAPSGVYRVGSLSLTDLTLALRTGVRGSTAPQWLVDNSLVAVETPNQIVAVNAHRWIMALSRREFWVLDAEDTRGATLTNHAVLKSVQDAATSPGLWPLYCQHSHAWLMLRGMRRSTVMAKLCGVDLSLHAFPVGQVAQTQMARIGVIVAHHHFNGEDVFSLFVDSAAVQYAWTAIADAMSEFEI